MSDRIKSLDTAKGLALLGVFFLHSSLLYVADNPSIQENLIGFVIISFSRLAVPLFFLISGYLLHRKLKELKNKKQRYYLIKYVKRLGKAYLIGTAIFIIAKFTALKINSYLELGLVNKFISTEITEIGVIDLIWNILYLGKFGADHLWFLPALLYSAIATYLAYRYGHLNKLLAIAAGSHLIAVLSRSYLIFDKIPVPRDDALFFGIFFTTAGFYISKEKLWSEKSKKFLLSIALLANILHLVERTILSLTVHKPFFWLNYSIFTSLATVTIFMYLLKNTEFGSNSIFNRYGQKTLLIYIIHPVIVGAVLGITGVIENQIGIGLIDKIMISIAISLITYFIASEMALKSLKKVKKQHYVKPRSLLKKISKTAGRY